MKANKFDLGALWGQLNQVFGSVRKQVSLNTIIGKAVFLALSGLIILLSLSVTVAIINRQARSITLNISDRHLPLYLVLSDIESGIDEATFAQYNYLLRGEASIREERITTWDETILPSVQKLKDLRGLLTEATVIEIDSLVEEINKYQKIQQATDNDVNQFFSTRISTSNKIDSANVFSEAEKMKESMEASTTISSKVSGEVSKSHTLIMNRVSGLKNRIRNDTLELISKVPQKLGRLDYVVSLVTLFGLLISVFLIIIMVRALERSLSKPVGLLEQLGKGELPDNIEKSTDELNAINIAGEHLVVNLKKASEFALAVGEGNFNTDFKPVSENDLLGNALMQMRNQLVEVAKQDEIRNWSNQGLSKFNEILRKHSSNYNELGKNLISNLVRYLSANQGGLFVAHTPDNETPYLELLAAFAFDRQKFITKKIMAGDGLVGQVYIEGETVVLSNIPDEFVYIKSGLGGANPTNVLISPLKFNDKVEGVIEIASFTQFPEHFVKFIEALGEGIASALANVKINEQTKRLLSETQLQAEAMRAQEEEMRQNMEELQATQEEMERKEIEMRGTLNAIDNATGNFTLDTNGEILQVNELQATLIKTNRADIIGQSHKDLITDEMLQSNEYTSTWNRVLNGQVVGVEMQYASFNDSVIWAKEIWAPMYNRNGEVNRILVLSVDITESKQNELKLKEQQEQALLQEEIIRQSMEELAHLQESANNQLEENQLFTKASITALNSLRQVVAFITNPDGQVIFANDLAHRITNLSEADMKNIYLFGFIDKLTIDPLPAPDTEFVLPNSVGSHHAAFVLCAEPVYKNTDNQLAAYVFMFKLK